LGRGVAVAWQAIREVVLYQAGDALWGPEIERVRQRVTQPAFVHRVLRAADLSPTLPPAQVT